MGGSERRSDRPQVKAGPLLLLLHQYIQPRLCAETRSSCCCARGTKVADWLAAMRASMGEEIFDGRRDFVRGIASSKHRDRNTSIGYYPSPLHGLPSVSVFFFFFLLYRNELPFNRIRDTDEWSVSFSYVGTLFFRQRGTHTCTVYLSTSPLPPHRTLMQPQKETRGKNGGGALDR
jgi:hypothetical protein